MQNSSEVPQIVSGAPQNSSGRLQKLPENAPVYHVNEKAIRKVVSKKADH